LRPKVPEAKTIPADGQIVGLLLLTAKADRAAFRLKAVGLQKRPTYSPGLFVS
jgi:hypothetical protein